MSQHRGLLTLEERARIMQLQDLLIDRFVEHREATAPGQEERALRSWRRKSTGSWPKRPKSRNGRLWARPNRPTAAIGYPITPFTHLGTLEARPTEIGFLNYERSVGLWTGELPAIGEGVHDRNNNGSRGTQYPPDFLQRC
jgi:hypothetical protein